MQGLSPRVPPRTKQCVPKWSVAPPVAPDMYPVWVVFHGIATADGFLRDWSEWLELNHRGGQGHPEDDFLDFVQCCSTLHYTRFSFLPCLGRLCQLTPLPRLPSLLFRAMRFRPRCAFFLWMFCSLPCDIFLTTTGVWSSRFVQGPSTDVPGPSPFVDKGKAIAPASDSESESESVEFLRDEEAASYMASEDARRAEAQYRADAELARRLAVEEVATMGIRTMLDDAALEMLQLEHLSSFSHARGEFGHHAETSSPRHQRSSHRRTGCTPASRGRSCSDSDLPRKSAGYQIGAAPSLSWGRGGVLWVSHPFS